MEAWGRFTQLLASRGNAKTDRQTHRLSHTTALEEGRGGVSDAPKNLGSQGRGWAAPAVPPRPVTLLPPSGHETSANHLAFTVMELSRQPEIVARYECCPWDWQRASLMSFRGPPVPTCCGWNSPMGLAFLYPQAFVLLSWPTGPIPCFLLENMSTLLWKSHLGSLT